MKIRVIIKEAVDDNATPKVDITRANSNQFSKSKPEEVLAKRFGMKIVKDVSVGETAYSNVYSVEPDDASAYPTKTLILKLSRNVKEYIPYEKISSIRKRMLESNDEDDKKAAKYLPIVYLTQEIQTDNDNPDYKSIIIMEPLREFTGNLKDMPRMLSGIPDRSPKLLIAMLKDEDFIHRVIHSIITNSSIATQVENLIFTGNLPNSKPVDIDFADWTIKSKFNNARMIRRIPEKPVEYYKYKRTAEEEEKVIAWQEAYDKEEKEFLNIMTKIRAEIKRISLILMDVLGSTEGAAKTDAFINKIKESTPVAPVSGANPYPQNTKTKPEEITPGAVSFNNALQKIEQYGLSRKDLHGKNYMMREDGQIVISDPGLFQTVDAIKESKNANYKI